MSPTLSELWPHGRATIGELTFETAQYVAQYTVKRGGKKEIERYRRWDSETGEFWYVEPEYITASCRPHGIGAPWFLANWKQVYPEDLVVIRGKERKPPRYYDLLLSRMEPEVWERVRRRRVRLAVKKQKALQARGVDPWQELAIRERAAPAMEGVDREPL